MIDRYFARKSEKGFEVVDSENGSVMFKFLGKEAQFYAEIDAAGRNGEIERASVNDDGTPEDTEVDAAYAAHLDGLWSQSLTLAR